MNYFLSRLISCRLCPRLVEYRESFPQDYWRKPVPPNGDVMAKIVIVGLAPAARGGNRTGRMFTGDKSANNLTWALYEAGLANKPTSEHKDDGLLLKVYVTSAVKCVPPENKPTSEEIRNCNAFLVDEIRMLKKAKVFIALGRIAWDALLVAFKQLGYQVPKVSFAHGAEVLLRGEKDVWLLGSYHPSPRNVNTGKLSKEKLLQVILRAKELAENSLP
ncbi:MAG: uracil-DNA glycosylase [Candidatus Aramenus sulfurataquae]|uniref:Type-5 uracil-DNA glycosylase n=3 Tax=Candidatus Aramenus sulfurataquae TaxID=1326980 RepID=A0AAE3K1V7_9CREN|nr:uracil-DNA glycosylase [Candidatus Aramenus sulfurataquae]